MNNPFELINERLGNIENLLLDIKNPPQRNGNLEQKEADTWFSLKELCNYLPDKPAPATVYGWVHSGTIPNNKGAKRLRFLKAEVDAWIKQGRRKTNAEIAHEADSYLTSKKNQHA
jgi:predicted DNA-binding transcriptional regulator AlpA